MLAESADVCADRLLNDDGHNLLCCKVQTTSFKKLSKTESGV